MEKNYVLGTNFILGKPTILLKEMNEGDMIPAGHKPVKIKLMNWDEMAPDNLPMELTIIEAVTLGAVINMMPVKICPENGFPGC